MQSNATERITIRNDLADLPKLQHRLQRFAESRSVPPRVVNQLQVVLDELASNIIKYSWPAGGAHVFSVDLSVTDRCFHVEITDDGCDFNPLQSPAPAPPSPGARPRPGGVGLHMVRQLVDEMNYARVDGCNRVTLSKQWR